MSYTYLGPQIVDFRPTGNHVWTREAACAQDGVGPMFPDDRDEEGIQYAKDICVRCPVRDSCLTEALNRNETHGVWGGYTTDERQAMNKS